MKITILSYLDSEKETELDPVVKQVARALRKHKHKVSVFGVHGDVKRLPFAGMFDQHAIKPITALVLYQLMDVARDAIKSAS